MIEVFAEGTKNGIKNTSQSSQSSGVLYVLYALMLAFIVYQSYKSMREKKKVENVISVYKPRDRKWLKVSFILLIFLALLSGDKIIALIMFLVGAISLWQLNDSILIGENGVYYNGFFDKWTEIKKWGFDKEKGDLEMRVKKEGSNSEEYRTIHARLEDMTSINNYFRTYILKKGREK